MRGSADLDVVAAVQSKLVCLDDACLIIWLLAAGLRATTFCIRVLFSAQSAIEVSGEKHQSGTKRSSR